MALRWPKLPVGAHVRTCQECGHTQVTKDPATLKSDGWQEMKCRKCKSESMDYGTVNNELQEEGDDYESLVRFDALSIGATFTHVQFGDMVFTKTSITTAIAVEADGVPSQFTPNAGQLVKQKDAT